MIVIDTIIILYRLYGVFKREGEGEGAFILYNTTINVKLFLNLYRRKISIAPPPHMATTQIRLCAVLKCRRESTSVSVLGKTNTGKRVYNNMFIFI